MARITDRARACIRSQKGYRPNKPPDAVMASLGLSEYVDLATNENPIGASPRALEAVIAEARSALHHYPESTCYDLAVRLSEIHGVKPEQILIDNGLDGVISTLGMAFFEPGDEVVVGQATFHAYENIAEKMGASVVRVPLADGYRLDTEAMAAAVNGRTKAVFICNPNNPTGTITTRAEFERLVAAVPEDVLVVSDEAFCEYVDHPDFPDTMAMLPRTTNLVVLRTFSKAMGLAGLRVGYAAAAPEIIQVMLKARQPFPVNRLAQAAALVTLDDAEYLRYTVEANRSARAALYHGLEQLNLRFVESQTNFVMVNLGRPASEVCAALVNEGVVVRNLEDSGLPDCIRICVGLPRDIQRLLKALEVALK